MWFPPNARVDHFRRRHRGETSHRAFDERLEAEQPHPRLLGTSRGVGAWSLAPVGALRAAQVGNKFWLQRSPAANITA